jgi:hypothetical protein
MSVGSSQSVLFVTAFLNIKRDAWTTVFKRTFQDYLKTFMPYFKIFANDKFPEQSLLVYIDKLHLPEMQALLSQNPAARIRLVPIDLEWMQQNCPMWGTLEREREIMGSESFQRFIPAYRKHNPETYIPEYTLINHCKIDYIAHAIRNVSPRADFYAWVDFGYFKNAEGVPENLLNVGLLDHGRINYTLLNPITQLDQDVAYTLAYAPERIAGYFFFGAREVMLEYQKKYAEILQLFQEKLGVADDDQALVLACWFRDPTFFNLLPMQKWHSALVLLQAKAT